MKIYHTVKTIILNSVKKVDASRISYRDQKNSFNILVDDNNKKLIAKITSSRNRYTRVKKPTTANIEVSVSISFIYWANSNSLLYGLNSSLDPGGTY